MILSKVYSLKITNPIFVQKVQYMNNKKALIKLLNCAISKEKPLDLNYKEINWDYIISESQAHSIYPLLYPVIRDIPVIALKGLILRSLYPSPDLRTMGDADILIRQEYIGIVTSLLISMSYIQTGEATPAHIVFAHKYYSPIKYTGS
jgi:hypothetical protein